MTQKLLTSMAREVAEMPEAVARLASDDARSVSKAVARELQQLAPKALITVARGSSDHAATYLSYAVQMVLGLPVASIGPSIQSVYGQDLAMDGLAALAISQSGGSEDISSLCRSFAKSGGHVVALTNTPKSPLATVSTRVMDVAAGPERAVAATKSFLNSIVGGLWLVADWADDRALQDALLALPDLMGARKGGEAFQRAKDALASAKQTMIIARGPGLGLAQEFALKLLETCAIQASSYSGAEVLHGPSALLRDGYPVIALTTGARDGMDQALHQLPKQGAQVIALPRQDGVGHPLVAPLLDVMPMYSLAEHVSILRGLDPDDPPHLNKVTKTT
ncbi:MAG: SIS domain-containing protein [Pseudomonadota bacterium]